MNDASSLQQIAWLWFHENKCWLTNSQPNWLVKEMVPYNNILTLHYSQLTFSCRDLLCVWGNMWDVQMTESKCQYHTSLETSPNSSIRPYNLILHYRSESCSWFKIPLQRTICSSLNKIGTHGTKSCANRNRVKHNKQNMHVYFQSRVNALLNFVIL